MVSGSIIFFYFAFFISMVSVLYTGIKLFLQGKNHLIATLGVAMAVGEFDVLFSIIWIDDFQNRVPKLFCIIQAIVFQYAVYVQIVAAVCFSYHIFQLLVNRKRGASDTQQKVYIFSIVVVPIIMAICVTIATVKNDSIRPFALNCDIKGPIWVRLIGYSGFNFVLTIPGVYLSARAAYRVFRHLDLFKTNMSHGENNSGASTTDIVPNSQNTTNSNSPNEIQIYVDNVNESSNVEATNVNEAELATTTTVTATRRRPTNRGRTQSQQVKAYNMTKAAAIRMVLFSCGFALINVAAAFQTVITILHSGLYGEVEIKGIGGNDFAGAFMGLMVFLVFGLPNWVRRLFTRKRKS